MRGGEGTWGELKVRGREVKVKMYQEKRGGGARCRSKSVTRRGEGR